MRSAFEQRRLSFPVPAAYRQWTTTVGSGVWSTRGYGIKERLDVWESRSGNRERGIGQLVLLMVTAYELLNDLYYYMKQLILRLTASYKSRKSAAVRGCWDFTGILVGNNKRLLVEPLMAMVRLVTNVSNRRWRKVIWSFTHFLFRLYRSNGVPGVVLYLKTCQLLLMQSVSGMRVNPRLLGSAVAQTRSGLPRVIPAVMRRRILSGDRLVLRVWLSLFSLYRVLDFPGTLKLRTIVDEGRGDMRSLVDFLWPFWVTLYYSVTKGRDSITRYVVEKFRDEKYGPKTPGWRSLYGSSKVKGSEFVPSWVAKNLQVNPFIIVKSGAQWGFGVSTHPLAILVTAGKLFRRNVSVWMAVTTWLQLTSNHTLAKFMKLSEMVAEGIARSDGFWRSELICGSLGRLGVKEEPAGKLRVFAMVDCWTQWMLHPLHRAIQKLLRLIPQDGTFDQVAPINRLIARLGPNQGAWSYDLSAATDRLPVSIQAYLLSFFLGSKLADAWKGILVERGYRLPRPSDYSHAEPKRTLPRLGDGYRRPEGSPEPFDSVKYAVGQPMGALSSWVMLALTHHLIVQFAWNRVNPDSDDWFTDYAVLGDDIVIANEQVAEAYLEIMVSEVGVDINIHKSLTSLKALSLEFAKRFYIRGRECSAFSFKELNESRRNISVWLEMGRKYGLSRATLLNLAGFPAKKSRFLCGDRTSRANPLGKSRWDIMWTALFRMEYVALLDVRSALYPKLENLQVNILERIREWSRMLYPPEISEIFRPSTVLGVGWVSTVKRFTTLVLRGPVSTPDYLALSGQKKGSFGTGAKMVLEWSRLASELLFGKSALYNQTQASALLDRSEQVKAAILSEGSVSDIQKVNMVDDIERELALIPAGYGEDLLRKSPKLGSLGHQIADVRALWRAGRMSEVRMAAKEVVPQPWWGSSSDVSFEPGLPSWVGLLPKEKDRKV